MRKLILIIASLLLMCVSSVGAVTLSISIGDYDTIVTKNSQFTVPVTITASQTQGTTTVSVTITPKSGLSCTSCTTTLTFTSDGSKTTSFVLKAEETGSYDAPFTVTATASGASATPQVGSNPIVVTEPPAVYNLILYNTSAPYKNQTDGKYYVPLVLQFVTGDVALENVTITLDLSGAASANAIVSSGKVSYHFSYLPPHSPVKVSWVARIDHFSVYGISGEIVANNYYTTVSHSQSGPEEVAAAIIAAAGGGGGGAIEVITKAFQELTIDLFEKILKSKNLLYKTYIQIPKQAFATFLALSDKIYKYPYFSELQGIIKKQPQKIEGDVYQITADQVIEAYAWAPKLIIARGDLEVDSYSALAFAKANGIPILLTKPEELPGVTKEALEKLSPREIIIIGGEKAVSKQVEEELKKLAKERVTRIWGETRIETSVELAKQIRDPKYIVIADWNSDEKAAYIAYLYKAPLIYVKGEEVPEAVEEYLKSFEYPPKPKVIFVDVNDKAEGRIESLL